MGRCAFASLA